MNEETRLKLSKINIFDTTKQVPLSDSQYLLCRDGGYLTENLINKTHDWYQLIKNEVEYKNPMKTSASLKQMEYISCLSQSECFDNFSYSKAREIIRNVEIIINEDMRYIRLVTNVIARAESKLASNTKIRNQRKSKNDDKHDEALKTFKQFEIVFAQKCEESKMLNEGQINYSDSHLLALYSEHNRLKLMVDSYG